MIKGKLKLKKRKKNSEPFIPNDNLYKTRKIEFQNPYAVPGKKSYGPSNIKDKRPKLKTIGKSILIDKEKILKNYYEDIRMYSEILLKLNSRNILHSIEKLTKEERNIVLLKYYETVESNHSFSVFKQYYKDFLEIKNLTKSIYTERIVKFIQEEINTGC